MIVKSLQQTSIIAAVFLAFISSVYAVSYPQVRDFVTDDANIIGPSYEIKIAELAKKIEQETTAETAVVTIRSLEGVDIETYAVELFEKAGIGKKDRDNGVLILIAPNEKKYRIEVGYGLEGALPDIRAREIGVNVLTPNFRTGDFGKGVYDALVTIYGYLTDNGEIVSKYNSVYTNVGGAGKNSGFSAGVYTLVMVFLLASFIGGAFGRRRHRMMIPVFLPGFGGGFGRGNMSGGTGFGGFGGGLSGGGGFSGGW